MLNMISEEKSEAMNAPTTGETAPVAKTGGFLENAAENSPVLKAAEEAEEKMRKVEKEVEEQYGPLLSYNDKGTISSLNQPGFAAMYHRLYKLVYDQDEARFYLYNPDNGLWEAQIEPKMISNLAAMILDYSRLRNIPELLKKQNYRGMADILGFLKGVAARKNCFKMGARRFVHCENGVLVFDNAEKRWRLRGFSPDDYSRNRSEVKYAPEAGCPRFLEELIAPAMSPEDAELLQLYAGQCLLGVNLSQTFLMITGTPGGGKSTLVNILEAVIGRYNCTELRLEHIERPFETARMLGKTLLTAKDVPSRFLNLSGASKLKALTGGDGQTAELKGVTGGVDFNGHFNVIVTSNSTLHVKLDGDVGAWRRRMLYIRYENPPPTPPVSEFDRLIVETEASGVLNWMLEGAAKLLSAGGRITRTPEQKKRVDELLLESDSVGSFVADCVKPDAERNITVGEMLTEYVEYCDSRDWTPLTENQFRRTIADAMLNIHKVTSNHGIQRNGKSEKGYSGMTLIRA